MNLAQVIECDSQLWVGRIARRAELKKERLSIMRSRRMRTRLCDKVRRGRMQRRYH